MKNLGFFVVVIVILAAIGKFARHDKPKAAAEPPGPAYGEARVKMVAGNRDIEMVVVGEKPTKSDCDPNSGTYKLPPVCSSGQITCKLTKVECSDTLGDRYLNMLAKKQTGVHYVHYVRKQGEVERKYAMVAWGLTAEESQSICAAMREGDSAEGQTVTCI